MGTARGGGHASMTLPMYVRDTVFLKKGVATQNWLWWIEIKFIVVVGTQKIKILLKWNRNTLRQNQFDCKKM